MHSILDVVAGAIAFLLILRTEEIWIAMLHLTERVSTNLHEFSNFSNAANASWSLLKIREGSMTSVK